MLTVLNVSIPIETSSSRRVKLSTRAQSSSYLERGLYMYTVLTYF